MPSLAPMDLVFARGVDTRNSPRLVDQAHLLQAHNRYFQADAGLAKRHGYAQLPKDIAGGDVISKGTSLVSYKNELLLFDDTYLYSYAADAGWVRRDVIIPTKVAAEPLAFNAYTQTSCSYAFTPTLEAWVYQDSRNGTDVRLSIRDRLTGAFILQDYLVASGRRNPRFAQTARGWVLLYTNTNPSQNDVWCTLYGRQFYGLAATPFGPENSISLIEHPGAYDVAFDGTTAVIGWIATGVDSGSPTRLGAYFVAPLHHSGRTATFAESGYVSVQGTRIDSTLVKDSTRIAIAFDPTRSGYVMVVGQYCTSSGSRARYAAKFVDMQAGVTWTWVDVDVVTWPLPVGGQTIGGGVVNLPASSMAAIVDGAGVGHVFVSVSAAPAGGAAPLNVDTGHLATTTPAAVTDSYFNTTLLSRPFFRDGHICVWLMNAGLDTTATPAFTKQPTAFAYNVTLRKSVATLAYGLATRQKANYGNAGAAPEHLPTVRDTGDGRWVAAMLKQTRLRSQNGQISTQSNAFLFTLRFVSAWQLKSARIGESQVFAGGVASSYDGATVSEHGFLQAPEWFSTSVGIPNSGEVLGNVQYVAVWEWTDAAGQVHRSAPSSVLTHSLGGPDPVAVNLSVVTMGPMVTCKTGVTLAIYRTSDNGVIFQRVTLFGSPTLNNQAKAAITFTDRLSDSAIAGNEILYTVGGELPNDPPPASELVVASKNRLFVAGGDDNDVVTFSKQQVKGSGIAFSLAFQRRISSIPGPITGLATMDDKIVVFKNPGICWWSGNGPSVSGVNDDFSATQVLTTELGCTEPASLVTTQDGIYFKSAKGLWLLTRSLELVQIGAPAQGYDGQTMVSAVMLPDSTQVRFGCIEDTALVYHYRMLAPFAGANAAIGQWTTFGNHAQAGAAIWMGAYAFVRGDGAVWVENAGYEDPTGPIGAVIKTAWLKAGGLLQAGRFNRLALLGAYRGPHRLRIDVAHDYRSTPLASMTFDTTVALAPTGWGEAAEFDDLLVWGGSSDDAYVMQGPLPVQQTAAAVIQLTISDEGLPGLPFGDSVSLEALSLLAQPEPELVRVGLNKTIG